ncbi:hypothetical protein LINPERHAP1_LOCUS1843 [Linum perenne]
MGFAFAAGTTDGPRAFDFQKGDDKPAILPVQMMGVGACDPQCTWRVQHNG